MPLGRQHVRESCTLVHHIYVMRVRAVQDEQGLRTQPDLAKANNRIRRISDRASISCKVNVTNLKAWLGPQYDYQPTIFLPHRGEGDNNRRKGAQTRLSYGIRSLYRDLYSCKLGPAAVGYAFEFKVTRVVVLEVVAGADSACPSPPSGRWRRRVFPGASSKAG